MESIFAQIRQESTEFYNNYISIVPGYAFNQIQTLKRINLYLNSEYKDGRKYLGRDKLFYNIIHSPCEVAMRMLNIDTKNIRLLPMSPKSAFSTYLLEKELKQWLKKNKLGKVLNQLAEEAPRYGSVVLQKTKDGAEVVDLRRLVLDPTVETIDKSRFVTTIHYLTPTELRDTGWDNVEEAIERFGQAGAQEPFQDENGNSMVMTSTPYIKVHKRYGEVPRWWLDNSKPGTKRGDEVVKALFIVAGTETQSVNAEGQSTGDLGVVLFKSRWYKPYPFKDFHYTKIKGRWLGLGVVEMLFDVQVRINELKNQRRVSMEISAMHLFQTPDKQIVRNVLTDLESGDLLLSANGITPVVNEERNLPAFDSEELSYLGQADRLSFAYEAIRGQEPNSNTTLGQTQIQTANATSVYAFKKENLSLFLQDFFNDLVMPNLMKDLTPEHIMRFTGSVQELDKLDEAAAELHVNEEIKQKVLNGERVNLEFQKLVKEEAIKAYRKLGANRYLKIKDAFYDDAEFEFDFIITNEQDDLATKTQNYQIVMSALIDAAGSGALNDPRVKLAFGKWAEQMGISQAEFELADQQATEQQSEMEQQLLNNPQQNGQAKAPAQKQAAPVAA